jgi:predicted DNA-binding transcriptional regulator YafY
MFFACQSLHNYKSLPFKNEVDAALHKFFHFLSSELKQKIERMQQRLVFWIPPHEMEVLFLKELLEAALEQRVVTIIYEASSRRERMRLNTTEEHIQTWIMRMDESDAWELEVDLTPEGVRRCRSDLWLTQVIELREDGSGTIRTKMSASYIPWTVHFSLGFGLEANVKRPQVVREQIQSKLRELTRQYEH